MKALLAIALMVGIFLIFTIIGGWIWQLLWNWFVVPVTDFRAITLLEALGLSLISGWVLNRDTPTKTGEATKATAITALIRPVVTVIFAFVIHEVLM